MRQQTYGISGGAGLVLGAALLWGTVGPAQGLAGEVMNPAALGGWRLVVGGAVLALLCRRHLRGLRPVLRRGLVRPLLVCALATGVFQAAFLYATARTGAALATVVALGVAPVATGVIARLVTGEALTRTWALSTAAAVLGCALLFVPDGAGRAEADVLGLLTAAASGVCYGLYTVYARRLATDHPGVHLPTVSALALLLGSVPLLPWMAGSVTALARPAALGLVAWLGLAATALAYWLFSVGLRTTGAAAVGTLSLAEPLAATVLGVFVLHEHLTATAATGSLLIMGGLVLACLPAAASPAPARREPAQPAPTGPTGPVEPVLAVPLPRDREDAQALK
ncbi:DMT family transporter [Streptomyces griseoaurantiacus]|uniref:DMT family transporter n=1 Tax=Streptomyces griseoaurantiacus TaxID=68213 RepID=UPI003812F20B